MNGSRQSLAAVALLCAALLAGCGSSGSSSSATSSATPAPSSSTASTQTSTGGAVGGGGEIKEALAACKHLVQSQTNLPGHAKAKLVAACSQAAKGNTAAVKLAAREVCEEVIGSSGVNGSAREAALKACRK